MLQVPILDLIDRHSKFCGEFDFYCVVPVRSNVEILRQHFTTNFDLLLLELDVFCMGQEAYLLLVSLSECELGLCWPAKFWVPLVGTALAELWMGRVRDHKSLRLMVDRFDQINGINWCVLCSSFVHKNFAFSFVARQLLLATEAVAFHIASNNALNV